MDWQDQRHADELMLQRQLIEALDAATKRALTEDEALLLAWASGVSRDFNKEIRK